MAAFNNKIEVASPSEEFFVWATPNNEYSKLEHLCKRKCNSDSGYMSSSVSPASGCRKVISNYMLTTPEISSRDRHSEYRKSGSLYTPAMKLQSDCLNKRQLQYSQEKKTYFLNTPTINEMDSFSDFLMDASLYNEPMDISMIESSPQLLDIENTRKELDLCEINKTFSAELPIETNSFCSEPATPMKRMNTDRLFKTQISFRTSYTSPRQKKCQTKKKVRRPRSLVGFEKVDILFQLGERANYSIAVRKILSYLSDSDLSSITMVSKTWKNICLSCPKSKERWLKYVSDRRERKENLHCVSFYYYYFKYV